LRLLYVAMTRARDTLILAGSVTANKWEALVTGAGTVTARGILAAKSYADWLGIWFSIHGSAPKDSRARHGELPNLRWRMVDDAELAGESLETGKPEAEIESPKLDEATVQKLRASLSWQYGFDAATARAAKSSVTALRRQAADELSDEAEPVFPARPGFTKKNHGMSAADAGTAHHTFLQHVSLNQAGEWAALEGEARRLEREMVLSAAERAALDLQAVARFWNSDEGRTIRGQAANVKRELAFTAKFSPQELSEIVGTKTAPDLENEFIVVQGVADLVVLLPGEIWLVDFKTEGVGAGELPAKSKAHEPQLRLYALALAKIYARPVTKAWLHFLAAQETVPVKIRPDD